jgi:hypothetical protein
MLVASPAQAATYVLHGVVLDAAGAPVAGLGVDYTFAHTTPAATTAADGSYELAVPGGEQVQLWLLGTYQGANFIALTEKFVMSSDRTENAVVPLGATARLTVTDLDGTPVSGAKVTAERFGVTPTSGGLSLVSRLDGPCSSNAAGLCELSALRGGSIQYFDVAAPGMTPLRLGGMDTPDAVNEKQLVLSLYHVGGALRFNSGAPVPGASVALSHDGLVTSTTTDSAGHFDLTSGAAVSAVLTVTGTVSLGSRSDPFELTSSPFSVNGPRNEEVTLPALTTLAVQVEDSLGASVAEARVARFGRSQSERKGSSSSGLAYTAALDPGVGFHSLCDRTDAVGVCEVTVFRGGTTPAFEVTPPGGTWQDFPGMVTDDDPTTVTAHLTGYASVSSAGTRPGTTLVRTSFGSGADIASLTPSTIELPDGVEPIVGRISYEVHLAPGASTDLGLTLPARANALLRVGDDGHLVDITSPGNPSGTTATVSITDGSVTDEDGVVNGVIIGSIVPAVRDPLVIESATLPAAVRGRPYQASLIGSGPVPPYTWRISRGALPPGLVLAPDGTISGTPTTLGTSVFDIQMRDSTGWPYSAERTVSLTVSTLAVSTTSVPDAYVGSAYSVGLQHIGGGVASWRVASGALPPGLRLSSTGQILGTPTAAGKYGFGVVVSAGGSSSPTQELTLLVRPMEVATTSLPNAPIGTSYSQKLTTLGGKGTLVWSVAGGALPPGLTLSSAGTLSGRPTAVGTYDVTVRVTDASSPKQEATRTFSITVTPMAILTSSLPEGKKGGWYSTQLIASGGKPTLAWSLAAGALPTGLNLSSAGRITGYPKATGTWTFTVRLTDASVPKNEATATLTLAIA